MQIHMYPGHGGPGENSQGRQDGFLKFIFVPISHIPSPGIISQQSGGYSFLYVCPHGESIIEDGLEHIFSPSVPSVYSKSLLSLIRKLLL